MFFFKKEGEKITDVQTIFDILLGKNKNLDYIYTLAEAHAIDLIAKMIAKCEVQIFNLKDGKISETKNDTYWRLNIQPNFNENGTAFLYKLVVKLLTNKKALVIINEYKTSKLLYVADDFEVSNKVLYEKTFSNISLSDGEENSIDLKKKYDSENTIYYSIQNKGLKTASDSFKENSSKLLRTVTSSLVKANTAKWRLTNPGNQPTLMDAETKKPISYDEYKTKVTEGLLSDEESIVLLAQIFGLENLNKGNEKNLTDFEKQVKQICDTVARQWNIPLDIFYGDKTEKSTGNEDFITFAVDPYFELLEDGFNISLIGKDDYLKGEYIKFNRMNINHRDIIDSANGIDKLTADGFSRNEINKLLGLPRINEDWADKHYITKNYAEGGAEGGG